MKINKNYFVFKTNTEIKPQRIKRKSNKNFAKSKKKSSFNRSQSSHLTFTRLWGNRGNSDISRCYGNYHASVYDKQSELGRKLTKNEKQKMFSAWYEYEVKHNSSPFVLREL